MSNSDKKTQQDPREGKAPGGAGTSRVKQSRGAKKRYDQIIFRDWCKGCGICSSFCPRKVIGRDEEGRPIIARPDECLGCRFCELHCPDFAVTIKERSAEA